MPSPQASPSGVCLRGLTPEAADPDAADALFAEVCATSRLALAGRRAIAFDPASAIVFDVVTPAPRHPNTLRLVARDEAGAALADETWLSVGGGFILREGAEGEAAESDARVPHPLPVGRRASRARPRVRIPNCAP